MSSRRPLRILLKSAYGLGHFNTTHVSSRSHNRLQRRLLSINNRALILGLRREDPNRIWERRAALTPDDTKYLIEKYPGLRVLIQPCSKRVFSLEEYLKAGAEVHSTLKPAHVILGIKEPPINEVHIDSVPSPVSSSYVARTYLMFSHTIKAQTYNMPLLSRFLKTQEGSSNKDSSLPALVDYELLTGQNGQRSVGFGWYAGVAGALEGLISTAHLFLELGVALPFLRTPRSHTASIPELRAALKNIGNSINTLGTPPCLGPFIICVTGTGQVARGALSILSELPVEHVTISNLPDLIYKSNKPLNKIYILHATPDSYLLRRDGGAYTREDYYANPTVYESHFYKLIAPYMTMIINGIGWTPDYPRLMSTDQLMKALKCVQDTHYSMNSDSIASDAFDRFDNVGKEIMKGRCRSFADISCDVKGGLEFLPYSSTLSEPFFKFKPAEFTTELPALQIMSVDILPSALPLDASKSFSKGILPYVENVLQRYYGRGTDAEDPASSAVDRAVVAERGKLVDKHAWLKISVDKYRSKEKKLKSASKNSTVTPSSKKNVLILGSGLVSRPAIDEICKRDDVSVIVAGGDKISVDALTRRYHNAIGYVINMNNKDNTVSHLIEQADVVISLLPASLHIPVAELCIEHRRNLVTASYISPDMRALHERATEADVLLLNEIGLDPGIDHCSAISLLSSLKDRRLKPISFISFCGGLPAPEFADVPLGYKFSWSPQGVLKAALNSARFKLDSKNLIIPSEKLLESKFQNIPVSRILNLEGIANRDSFPYAESYNLAPVAGLRTLLRGTLRYPGYCETMQSFRQIGLLDENKLLMPDSWQALPRQSLELRLRTSIPDQASFHSALADVLLPASYASLLETLSWLGLTKIKEDINSLPALPNEPCSPLALLALLLSYKLQYQPHERDLVILHHEIVTQTTEDIGPPKEQLHISSLELYGDENASAMSRCVGLPVAFAALKILDGSVNLRGVHGPTDPAIYMGILKSLDKKGIRMKHKTGSARIDMGIEYHLRTKWLGSNERYSMYK